MICWQTIIDFLDSNFVQSVATIGAVVLGLSYFFVQQRGARLQKIYFDDGLLKQMREIDDGLAKTYQYGKIFANAMDNVFNLIKQTFVDKDILLKVLTERIASIQEVGQFGEATKEIINFLIPDERGDHITQWFTKYNDDINTFSATARGQLSILANDLSVSDSRRDKIKDQEMFEKMMVNISKLLYLLVRHRVMVYWFCVLVRHYADLKFSTRDELAGAYKRDDFSKIITNLDESFKMLFCFYETEKKFIYFSYAKDEDGNYFQIVVEKEDVVRVSRKALAEKPIGKLKLIVNDTAVALASIEDTKNNFITALVGLTNLRNFERRPNIITEKQRFDI